MVGVTVWFTGCPRTATSTIARRAEMHLSGRAGPLARRDSLVGAILDAVIGVADLAPRRVA